MFVESQFNLIMFYSRVFFFFFFLGLLTRNSSFELEESKSSSAIQKKKIYDAIATASIISNSAGVDTSRSQIITLSNFSKFLETKQFERMTEAEVIKLIHVSIRKYQLKIFIMYWVGYLLGTYTSHILNWIL